VDISLDPGLVVDLRVVVVAVVVAVRVVIRVLGAQNVLLRDRG
jgi:hypothetical protein